MDRTGQGAFDLLVARVPGREWAAAWDYEGTVTTWRSDDLFAKVKPADATVTLLAEGERMEWLSRYVPTPEVVMCENGGAFDLLVTRALPGSSAAHRDEPAEVRVRWMADALRVFHDELPIAECPFDFTLDVALAQAQGRAPSVTLDDLHTVNQPLGVAGAVAKLESDRPDEGDAVVCHGDFCFPNVLFDDDGTATGYLDVGELGVADRWWDLAVATWSVEWNVGSDYEDLFLDCYGAERDAERQAYYRLLYDLVS